MSFQDTSRQLVNDTNQGFIQPKRTAAREIGQKAPLSQARDYNEGTYGTLEKSMNSMMTYAEPHVNARIQESQDLRLQDAYHSDATTEALQVARDEQGPISSAIFGPSPEVRGIQQKIQETRSEELYSTYANDLRTGDADSFTESQWVAYTNKHLDEQLEGLDDEPELRNAIRKQHNEVVKRMAPKHAIQHEAWKQGQAAEAHKKSIRTAGDNVIANAEDPQFMTDLLFKMNQQEDQTDDAWKATVTEEALGLIHQGVPEMFEAFQQSTHWDRLDKRAQDSLQVANSQHIMTQTSQGLAMRGKLDTALRNGDAATVRSVTDQMNALLPADQQIDTNANILKAQENNRKNQAALVEKQAAKTDMLRGNGGDTESFDGLLNDWAGADYEVLLREQLSNGSISQQQFDEGIAAGPSQQDVRDWVLQNPERVTELSMISPGVSSNLVRTAFAQPLAMMATAETLDKNNPNDAFALEQIQSASEAFNTLMVQSPQIALKAVGGSENAEKLTRYGEAIASGLDLSYEAKRINAEINNNYDLPSHLTGPGGMNTMLEDMSQVVVDSVSTGLFGTTWFNGIKNDADVQQQLRQSFEKHYRATGDEKTASTRAVNELRGNMTTINGVASMNMAETEQEISELGHGVSLEKYVNYMVKDDPVFAEEAKAKGLYSGMGIFSSPDWSRPGTKLTRVGDYIEITVPSESDYEEPSIISLPVPKSGAVASGMTEAQFNRHQRRYNPASFADPNYQ